MKQLILGMAAVAAAGAFGTDWTWRESGQTDRKLTTPSNWASGTAPVSDAKATRLFLSGSAASPLDGATFVNDYAPTLAVKRVNFGSYTKSATLTGNPLYLGNDNLDGGSAGASVTFDLPIYSAASNAASYVKPPSGGSYYFKKPLRNGFAAQDAAAKTQGDYSRSFFRFEGSPSGTNYIDGGIDIPNGNSHDAYAQNGLYCGVMVVRSDVTVPSWYLEGGSTLIITDGATMTTTGANLSFLRNGTVEIENGCLRLQNAGVAQLETTNVVFNVREGGVLDTTTGNFRSGNDGFVIYNVYAGGSFYWRANNYTAEKGACHINLYGGRLVMGDAGGGILRFGRSGTLQRAELDDEFLLKGGTFLASRLMTVVNTTDVATCKSRLHLDGGTIVAGGDGTFTTFGEKATVSSLAVDVRAGGMTFDTVDHAVAWTVPFVAADNGDATGVITKRGTGTFTLSAASAADFKVVSGTLAVGDAAYLAGRCLDLRPQGKVTFSGSTLPLAALTAKYGVVRLACGTQTLALSAAPTVEDALVFDLVDASGNAFATDGTYTLLTAPSLDAALAAQACVLSPVAGKSYAFALADNALTVTIADGTAPAAPVFPAAEDALVSVDAGETATVATQADVPAALNGGTLSYANAGAASLSLGELNVTASSTIRRESGAGDLTLEGPVLLNCAPAPGLVFENGDWNAETLLTGWWYFPAAVYYVAFRSGRIRLEDGCRFNSLLTNPGAIRVGGGSASAELTVDAGATMTVANLAVGPKSGTNAAITNAFSIAGGSVKTTTDTAIGTEYSHALNRFAMSGGAFTATDGSWFNLVYGDTALEIGGGTASFAKLALGYQQRNDMSCDFGSGTTVRGALRRVSVAGGDTTVREGFSWASDISSEASAAVDVTGGSLALPPTVRPQEASAYRTETATLKVDGGALVLNGAAGLEGASAADYLHGADSLSVGARGMSVAAAADATVTQPVRGTARTGGDFVKRGAGTLTLAGTNVLFGAVDVEEGTLVAGLEQRAGVNTPVPPGLVAYWDFDGDDPLADKSGHGNDLVQYSAEHPVAFTAGDADKGYARNGNCAYWDGSACAVICTNFPKAPLLHSTSCAWFRLKTLSSVPSYNRNIFSTRPNKALTGNVNTYDFTLKSLRNLASCWGSDKVNYQPDKDIALETWHHLAVVRDYEKMQVYMDGVCVTNYDFGTTYWRTREVIESDYVFSIGMGIANGEFMCKGGMIDDVALYGRALTADEIAALYQDAPQATTNAVKVAAGATWNMAGRDAVASSLAGGGQVTNGRLTLTGLLQPATNAVPYVAELVVANANGVIDLGRTAEDPVARQNATPLVTVGTMDDASAANLARWTVVNTGLPAAWRAHLKVEGGKLLCEAISPGTTILFR